MFLKRLQRPRIGLNINTDYLTWVQIEHPYRQIPLIKQYEIINFIENSIQNHRKMRNLKNILSKIPIGIALSDSKIKSTTLTLDSHLTPHQLKKIFIENAALSFNQPIEKLYFQYQILGFSKNEPHKLNFLLVTVERKEIENNLASFKHTMEKVLSPIVLKPQLIDVESFARHRAEESLKNSSLLFDNQSHQKDFFQKINQFSVSLGLAIHPCFNQLW